MRRPAARTSVSRVGAMDCCHCSGWFESAGLSLSAWARRRRMVPRRVTLVLVSCVRAWPHSKGGIQTCWPWVLAGSPEHKVSYVLVEAVAWAGQVAEGFECELGPVLL